MSQGFFIRTTSGKLIDSTVIPVTLLDIIAVPAGGGGVKSYPELADKGVTLGVAVQKNVNTTFRNIEATASVVNGVPTVSWAPSGSSGAASGALVIVFVR